MFPLPLLDGHPVGLNPAFNRSDQATGSIDQPHSRAIWGQALPAQKVVLHATFQDGFWRLPDEEFVVWFRFPLITGFLFTVGWISELTKTEKIWEKWITEQKCLCKIDCSSLTHRKNCMKTDSWMSQKTSYLLAKLDSSTPTTHFLVTESPRTFRTPLVPRVGFGTQTQPQPNPTQPN